MAIVSPPLPAIQNLRPHLNPGEEQVLAALMRLDDDWRIYVQPRLRMDQPDFVAIHDELGVWVFEVKDWTPGLNRQRDDGVIEVFVGGQWQPTQERPRLQAHWYRQTIIEHFFTSPESGTMDWPVVRAMVVLPQYETSDANRVLWRHHLSASSELRHQIAVCGADGLAQPELRRLVVSCPPRTQDDAKRLERLERLERLKYHLREPEVVADQRRPLEMSDAAKNLARNPNQARIRRARGPAGSGKSLGLAARAAALAAKGRSVLVLSYNITLPHYLHDLAARHGAELSTSIRNIVFTHFHGFCSRARAEGLAVGFVTGEAESEFTDETNPDSCEHLVDAAITTYRAGYGKQYYDAILIDEGQDFTAKWWNFLREFVLNADGEMLLVADTTQDLYNRKKWTVEKTMNDCGFRGDWTDLKGSYRMPPDLIPIIAKFGRQYLKGGDDDLPEVPIDNLKSREAAEPTLRVWTNVANPSNLGTVIADEVMTIVRERALHAADIVFLCEEHQHGLQAAKRIRAANQPLMHVFTPQEGEERRRAKHRFWGGANGIKGCTVQSFKGWEARGVVLCILPTERSKRLAYVALTRVKGLPDGRAAVVRVVNCDPSLNDFKKDFEQVFTVSEVPGLGGQKPLFTS